uniref:Uncharacterized protein n=1 Tax=Chromera velia CCMP2878 TaxID=1169474 RepID=A0A0G4F7Z0_9ALVE|eukprot:Cvel_15693.t1-p1 / transcript=Cvel_15693.t1 / gene=Cvel_15693 / organism=Chromera_velia_CCMP2878 / gene_product=hypothetical protein / transcript_product=hypothetical protein / location=Cvel_scaffold1171:39692-42149(-) / protein_length=373 / sequence_SO=supercontig / SO=protein_coding / is_pseudo=false
MVSAPPSSLPFNSSSSSSSRRDQRGAGGARTRPTSRRTVRASVRGSPESSLTLRLGFPLPSAKIPTEASSSSLPHPPLGNREGDEHTRGCRVQRIPPVCGARGGGMKWIVKKPVVDSGYSRHFFGRDVESCVIEVRETDSEFVGVEGDVARAASDVTVDLPGVECVDGGRRTARLNGAFSRGKEGFFAGVKSDSVVCVLVKTDSGKGWRPLRVHPSAVSLIEWYGLNVSSDFLNGVSESAAAPADDVDCFSDFNVEEDREVDVLAAGGTDPEGIVSSSSKSQAIFPDSVSSTAAGHLELRGQQQEVGSGEEKEKQSGQGREPVQAAQPVEKEGEGKVVPPDIPDDDSLFGLNLLGESGGAAALASFLAREGEQ